MPQIENCIIKFKCSQSWESLATSDKSNRRYCCECKKDVYGCYNDADIAKHVKAGRCIAILNYPNETLFVGELKTPYGIKS